MKITISFFEDCSIVSNDHRDNRLCHVFFNILEMLSREYAEVEVLTDLSPKDGRQWCLAALEAAWRLSNVNVTAVKSVRANNYWPEQEKLTRAVNKSVNVGGYNDQLITYMVEKSNIVVVLGNKNPWCCELAKQCGKTIVRIPAK